MQKNTFIPDFLSKYWLVQMYAFHIIVGVFLLSSCDVEYNSSTYNESESKQQDSLSKVPIYNYVQKGVQVRFSKDDDAFPKEWLAPPYNVKADTSKPELRYEAFKGINQALAKYPQEMLSKNLKRAYFFSDFYLQDVLYGGTMNENDKFVYLLYNPAYNAEIYEEIFHHEFNHLYCRQILYSYISDEIHSRKEKFMLGWQAATQATYGKQGIDALKEDVQNTLDEEAMKEGFLTQYAKSNPDEDIAVTAEHLFTGNPKLWEAVEKYPIIAKKVDLLIGFLHDLIDPTFDKDYFKNLVAKKD